jgi:tetratricopeptide (TPR) repeat protein
VVGDTPNLAARLQGLAEPGSVVIAKATRDLLGDLFELCDMGPQHMKGLAEATPAFTVIAPRALESRFAARHTGGITPIVGRDRELALLIERWSKAKSGEGQIVLVTGEAGIGKSRLTEALVDAIRGEPHFLLRYQCSPYHSDSALYPVVQHIRQAAGLTESEDEGHRLDRLEAFLTVSKEKAVEVMPLIAALAGVDASKRYAIPALSPQQRRMRTSAALLEDLSERSRRMPVLWLIEDAHWIDPTTLELIQIASGRLPGARVLALITRRPSESLGFDGDSVVTTLELSRLSQAASRRIVASVAGGKPFPDSVLDKILAATDGVPLFVEESTKALLESGALRETGTGWQLAAPLAHLSIPSSLHDSLMARLDRLPSSVKEVAQSAAVIGRTFDQPMLTALSPLPSQDLFRALDHLVEAELIFCSDSLPAPKYLFKHALVRDAAYESLLKSSRRALHLHLLEVMEANAGIAPEVLAHHAHEGGAVERAVGYWRQAAEAASSRKAHREAAALYALALGASENIVPEERASMLEACAWQDFVADSVTLSVARYEQALQIWKAQGRTLDQGRVMCRLGRAYFNRCRGDACRRITYEAVALLQDFPESPEYLEALVEITRVEMLAGNNSAVFDVGARALPLAEQRMDQRLIAQLLNNIGCARCQSGDFAAGIGMLERSFAVARENRDEDAIGRFYTNMTYKLVERRQYERAERLFEQCVEAFRVGEDSDIYYWQGLSHQPHVHLARGRWDEAESCALRALSQYRPSGALPFRIYPLTVMGRLTVLRGKSGADAYLSEAGELAAGTGHPQRIAPVAIARCEMLWLGKGHLDDRSTEMQRLFAWVKELGRQPFVDELGYWLWRCGERVEGVDAASPRGLQIAGHWREAAEEWHRIGCPLEEGQSLLDGDGQAVARAVEIFEGLGAALYLSKASLRLEQCGYHPAVSRDLNVSGS